MTCHRCSQTFHPGEPHFCAPADREVLYKTSTVLITMGASDRIYRSINDAPKELQEQMEKAAMSCDSASIVIADRAGRDKIEDALNLIEKAEPESETAQPGPSQIQIVLKIGGMAALVAATALVLIWLFTR
jgi:hypothetical protein